MLFTGQTRTRKSRKSSVFTDGNQYKSEKKKGEVQENEEKATGAEKTQDTAKKAFKVNWL